MNVPARKAHEVFDVLTNLRSESIDHPPYSPDLAQFDYFLFPSLKKRVYKRRTFSIDAEVIKSRRLLFQC